MHGPWVRHTQRSPSCSHWEPGGQVLPSGSQIRVQCPPSGPWAHTPPASEHWESRSQEAQYGLNTHCRPASSLGSTLAQVMSSGQLSSESQWMVQ